MFAWQVIKSYVIPILIIIIAILIGYHELFFGADVFVYKDQYVNSDWSYGNSFGNGWRSDKGFGTSFFYADPGAWHTWSPVSLWERLIASRKIAYHTTIVGLDILAAIAIFFFLRRIVPGLGMAASLLAPLVIFTVDQSSTHFNRLLIPYAVGMPLFLMLLYDFYKQSRLSHFFFAALLFWFVIFFGAYWNFSVILSMAFIFTITYCVYYKEPWKKIFFKYVLLFFVGGLGTILLGFWEFYSIFVEHSSVGYLREKVYMFPAGIIPDIKDVGHYFLSFFQFYSIPTNMEYFGLGWRPFYYSYNIVAIFPLVFIFFLFRRSHTFWEFSLKWLLVVFYVFHALILIPVLNSAYTFIASRSLLMINFYSWFAFVIPLQIGLLGIFIFRIAKNDFEIKQQWGRYIQTGVSSLLFVFYAGLTILSFFALLMPDFLFTTVSSLAERFSPERLGRFSKEFLVYGAVNNIHALQNSMHWYSLTFYLLSALTMFVFMRRERFFPLVKNRAAVITGILLFSAIVYSWTVYPLNHKQPVWQEIAPDLPVFASTDRFYYVKEKSLSQQPMDSNTLAEIKRRVKAAGGALKFMERRDDHHESVGLGLHGWKAFTQKDEAEFIYHIFNGDGVKRLADMRRLAPGPMITSELLDMGAVSYYYSIQEIEDKPEQLSLYVKTKLLYIYKNHAAWPYFYLAKRLEVKEDGKHLKNVQKGTAYLAANNFFKLPENAGNSNIQLKEFSHGRMVFDYYGDRENFLVVADAWHPFWKAKTENQNLSVVKANEIFKGVKIPSGKHTLTLFFDTSPYYLGIYVSVIAWILFLAGLILVLKYKW